MSDLKLPILILYRRDSIECSISHSGSVEKSCITLSFFEPLKGSLAAQLDLGGAQGSKLPRNPICVASASGAPDPVAGGPQSVRACRGVASRAHHDIASFTSAVRLRFGEAVHAK